MQDVRKWQCLPPRETLWIQSFLFKRGMIKWWHNWKYCDRECKMHVDLNMFRIQHHPALSQRELINDEAPCIWMFSYFFHRFYSLTSVDRARVIFNLVNIINIVSVILFLIDNILSATKIVANVNERVFSFFITNVNLRDNLFLLQAVCNRSWLCIRQTFRHII
jgi:hypothetical protein